jgi:hypothetical protein
VCGHRGKDRSQIEARATVYAPPIGAKCTVCVSHHHSSRLDLGIIGVILNNRLLDCDDRAATFGVILCAVVTGDSVAPASSHVIGRELDTQVSVGYAGVLPEGAGRTLNA